MGKMMYKLDITFAHDYDSDLYMLSNAPDSKAWNVTIHCHDGEKKEPPRETFTPYPGCEEHRGETAWCVDYYNSEKIEIKVSEKETVIIEHPDAKLWKRK